jgi:hypothetical protein
MIYLHYFLAEFLLGSFHLAKGVRFREDLFSAFRWLTLGQHIIVSKPATLLVEGVACPKGGMRFND